MVFNFLFPKKSEVAKKILVEIAEHEQEIISGVKSLPSHEYLHIKFDSEGKWMKPDIVRPHHDDPKKVSQAPHDIYLTGVKDAGSEEEAHKGALKMVENAKKHFSK